MQEIIPYIFYTGVFFKQGVFPYLCGKLFLRDIISNYQTNIYEGSYFLEDAVRTYPTIIRAQSIYISHKCYYHYRVVVSSLKRSLIDNVREIMQIRYNEWKMSLCNTKYWGILKPQIIYYIAYMMIWTMPHELDNKQEQQILSIYGGINKNDNIILYGAGAVGKQLYDILVDILQIKVCMWVDKNAKELHDLPVKEISEIQVSSVEKIIIAILRADYVQNAIADLVNRGVPREKIFWVEQKYVEHPEWVLDKANFYID